MKQEDLITKVLEKAIAAHQKQSVIVFNLEARIDLMALEADAKDKEIAELQKALTDAVESKPAADDVLDLEV
jgi:hypothetical protein